MNDWMVVDGDGQVISKGLSVDGAKAMMEAILTSRPATTVRMSRASAAAAPLLPQHVPAMAPTTVVPMPAIAPGLEREALREAIEGCKDADKRLADARQAVERAQTFLDEQRTEHDTLHAAHEAEIQTAGASIAESFRTGVHLVSTPAIDRSALMDSEARLSTARVALNQLEADLAKADAARKGAETRVRLAALAVMRADVDRMTERLDQVQREAWGLRFAISAAKLHDVAQTVRTNYVLQNDVGDISGETEASRQWAKYSAALRVDAGAAWENQ